MLDFFAKKPLWTPSSSSTMTCSEFPDHEPTTANNLGKTAWSTGRLLEKHLTKKSSKRPKKYEQLQFDLGTKQGPVNCKECLMSYRTTHSEDLALHAKYHKAIVQGIDYKVCIGALLISCLH
jgi:hypothetical protein